MVVVGAVIIVDVFVGDMGCCGCGEWWSLQWLFSMCLWVTWGVADMASGGGHTSGSHVHVSFWVVTHHI